MARRFTHILPFRIPFFRIFYSTTYTTVYIICLCILAITPVSMIWASIENAALQYTLMIGASYLLTAILAIVIYSSRMFTNRTVAAGVGKPYIPVEEGELGRSVRKMIVKQMERSAIVAWESRPRDLLREILRAAQQGWLPPETVSVGPDDYTVGREIPIDPAYPPWGDIQHAGWSSPAHREDHEMPDLQFANVIAELPNLIEARAVSLAPADPTATPTDDVPMADPSVVEVLRRPETMGMRDYLTQLAVLGLLESSAAAQSFLLLYENARFGGLPITEAEFQSLMSAFAELLSGMTKLQNAVVEQIREQAADDTSSFDNEDVPPNQQINERNSSPPSPPHTPDSSHISPVTARTAPSRNLTPYLQQDVPASADSLSSVMHHQYDEEAKPTQMNRSRSSSLDSLGLESVASDIGSVVRHSPSPENG